MKTIAASLAVMLLIGAGVAQGAVTWTTGDLGYNVIWDAGDFQVNPGIAGTPTSAIMTVKSGLWNSPEVTLSVLVNSNSVGSILADNAYISDGPKTSVFDITGLLTSGTNSILFTGYNQNDGDYVIGQVDIEYRTGTGSVVPAPGAFLLGSMGIGLISLIKGRKAM